MVVSQLHHSVAPGRGLSVGASLALCVLALFPARALALNAIEIENALAGTPPTTWDISGIGDPSIQGFATDISVNRGSTVRFKIDTDAAAYHIDIYRLGYYQGNGARLQGVGRGHGNAAAGSARAAQRAGHGPRGLRELE